MATATHHPISVSEYLHTSYRSDYVHGTVDPATRKGFDCSAESWIETVDFAVGGTGIHIGIGTIFAAIDEERSR